MTRCFADDLSWEVPDQPDHKRIAFHSLAVLWPGYQAAKHPSPSFPPIYLLQTSGSSKPRGRMQAHSTKTKHRLVSLITSDLLQHA